VQGLRSSEVFECSMATHRCRLRVNKKKASNERAGAVEHYISVEETNSGERHLASSRNPINEKRSIARSSG
jgi:hypothetical protein